jgi:hypothetical protein
MHSQPCGRLRPIRLALASGSRRSPLRVRPQRAAGGRWAAARRGVAVRPGGQGAGGRAARPPRGLGTGGRRDAAPGLRPCGLAAPWLRASVVPPNHAVLRPCRSVVVRPDRHTPYGPAVVRPDRPPRGLRPGSLTDAAPGPRSCEGSWARGSAATRPAVPRPDCPTAARPAARRSDGCRAGALPTRSSVTTWPCGPRGPAALRRRGLEGSPPRSRAITWPPGLMAQHHLPRRARAAVAPRAGTVGPAVPLARAAFSTASRHAPQDSARAALPRRVDPGPAVPLATRGRAAGHAPPTGRVGRLAHSGCGGVRLW